MTAQVDFPTPPFGLAKTMTGIDHLRISIPEIYHIPEMFPIPKTNAIPVLNR
jgi:hypothetical protein